MNQKEVSRLRKKYRKGTRIKCILMNDNIHPVPKGTLGTINYVDDAGTIHMKWDNGSSLGLIADEDYIEVICEEIEIGSFIVCKEQKIKVAKILTQDSYIFQGQEIHDIEFYDEEENYHHWKSNLDGGYIIRE